MVVDWIENVWEKLIFEKVVVDWIENVWEIFGKSGRWLKMNEEHHDKVVDNWIENV